MIYNAIQIARVCLRRIFQYGRVFLLFTFHIEQYLCLLQLLYLISMFCSFLTPNRLKVQSPV